MVGELEVGSHGNQEPHCYVSDSPLARRGRIGSKEKGRGSMPLQPWLLSQANINQVLPTEI